jgi:flagellar hook assembly protein FlgD
VELVSVEAATFMGGSLEANVTAKVIPTAYALHQNYPNPFNPSTSMAIDFPNAGDYTLTVYNIAGQTVKTFSGSTEAGTLTITWDGNDNRGSKVASGVYFYRVEADAFHAVKKMVLMK